MAEEIVSTALLFLGVVLGPAIFLLSILVYGVNRTISWVAKYKEQRYLRSLPCSNCRYFMNGEFLQCAVNPRQVLTDDASRCYDFVWSANEANSNKLSSYLRTLLERKAKLNKPLNRARAILK